MIVRLAALAALCMLNQLASAAALGSLEIQDGSLDTYAEGIDPVAYRNSIAQGAASASLSVDTESGSQLVSAIAPANLASDGLQHQAVVESFVNEFITFAAGAGGTGYLDWRWHGAVSPVAAGGPTSSTNLNLYVDSTVGTRAQYDSQNVLTNTSCDGVVESYSCTVGTSIDQTGSVAFTIEAGTFKISTFMGLFVSDGATGDTSNGAHIYLRLPTGVTYTSDSGRFLATAAPIFAVPEPGANALMLLGLGLGLGAGIVARRRRQTFREAGH